MPRKAEARRPPRHLGGYDFTRASFFLSTSKCFRPPRRTGCRGCSRAPGAACWFAFPGSTARLAALQESESIQCPFCGQSNELVIDTSVASQRFTTDCEVCCRPFEVLAECEPGEVLSVEVQAN